MWMEDFFDYICWFRGIFYEVRGGMERLEFEGVDEIEGRCGLGWMSWWLMDG